MKIRRLVWLLFCIIVVVYGTAWMVYIPTLITVDFWRGIFYPIAVVVGIGHYLMAGTSFWYSVVKEG